MARPHKKNAVADETITRSCGNVFADLDLDDADERETKARLAHVINGLLKNLRLSQSAAADRLDVGQPKISALMNYKLSAFSVEKLMTFLNLLGCDVDIVIKKKKALRASGRIFVRASA